MSVVLSRFTRFIHWGIAGAVFVNLFIVEDGEVPHQILGYAAVLLVVTRLVYGYTTKNHRHYPNKLAFITYFSIWTLIAGLAVSGYLMGTDAFFGSELVEEIHEFFAGFLQGLIVIHLAGIALDSYLHKRKTWMAMIKNY